MSLMGLHNEHSEQSYLYGYEEIFYNWNHLTLEHIIHDCS